MQGIVMKLPRYCTVLEAFSSKFKGSACAPFENQINQSLKSWQQRMRPAKSASYWSRMSGFT